MKLVVAGGLVALEAAGHGVMVLLEEVGVGDFFIEEDARVAHSSSGFWLDEWGARVLEGASRGGAAFVVPHSRPKCEGVNGPPGVCVPPAVLIELIETLIEEWYVHRHERAERMSKIVAVAAAKKAKKAQAETS